MKGIIGILLFISIGTTLKAQVPMIKYGQLESMIVKPKSDLLVVNFWATWCGPCIKELPYFEEANKMNGVDVLLVSLDFPQEYEKVNAFVKKKNIQSTVYLLDEKDYDSYMGKIDESWSGAIPATLLIDPSGKQWFFEKAFNKEDLFKEISKRIN